MSFSLNLRGSFAWWSEEERTGGREEEGGGFEEMTSEGDRREMKDVETDEERGGREGGDEENSEREREREGWGRRGPLFLFLECSPETVCCSEEK